MFASMARANSSEGQLFGSVSDEEKSYLKFDTTDVKYYKTF